MCISKFRYGHHPSLLFLFERELCLQGLISRDQQKLLLTAWDLSTYRRGLHFGAVMTVKYYVLTY